MADLTYNPTTPAFLARKLPLALLFGSFLFLTLPLTVLLLTRPAWVDEWRLPAILFSVLGVSHVVLTLTLYLQSSHLHYFASTFSNRLIYFVVPLAILTTFALYQGFGIAVYLPVLDPLIRGAIRFADFLHLNRQSFGVLLLLQGSAGRCFPSWHRRAANGFFLSLVLLLTQTYLHGGHFPVRDPMTWILGFGSGLLALAVIGGFVGAWVRSGHRAALLPAFGYFFIQSGLIIVAIGDTGLYFCPILTHWVEYHVLMIPRSFHSPLDERQPVDRLFERLRNRRTVFYFFLLVGTALVCILNFRSANSVLLAARPRPFQVALSLFDGLFLLHVFVDSFIWKFGTPFFRQQLVPLYFGRQSTSPTSPALIAAGSNQGSASQMEQIGRAA